METKRWEDLLENSKKHKFSIEFKKFKEILNELKREENSDISNKVISWKVGSIK